MCQNGSEFFGNEKWHILTLPNISEHLMKNGSNDLLNRLDKVTALQVRLNSRKYSREPVKHLLKVYLCVISSS